ncbi:MAG: type IV-A pilus assembly ATPase PilB, partial [Methylomonas sp.]
MTQPHNNLAKWFIEHGLLTEQTATLANLNPENNLNTKIVATDFGIPFVDLERIDLKHLPLALVSSKLIREHLILPIFKHGNGLLIATADPSKLRVLDEIKFHTRLNIEQILVEE